MKFLNRCLLGVAASSLVAMPIPGYATNGMFLIGQGAKSRGMGGAAIAFPQDAIAGAVNPASIGMVGTRADIGADVFSPRAHSNLGGTGYNSSASLYLMPVMGGAYKFNRNLSVGFSAVPAGGGGSFRHRPD